MAKMAKLLVIASVLILAAAVAVVVTEMRGGDEFPWGIHLVTIPAVFLVGLIAGWVMRERQAAEERAKAEIDTEQRNG
jgi:F0F1-type ATP synthase assembly protein I